MIPELIFFRGYWSDYHFKQSNPQDPAPRRPHLSTTELWRSMGPDIWEAYLMVMRMIMEPPAYVAFRALVRLQDVRKQRSMEKQGILPQVGPGILPSLSDEQLDRFIELAYGRLQRLLHPAFVPRIIHRLLWELGLFVYNGPTGALCFEDTVILALGGTMCGQVGGRAEVRHRRSVDRRLMHIPVEDEDWIVKRVRHPMLERMPHNVARRVWRYMQGGRVFLWLSSVVYWRYWREFRRGNTRLGEVQEHSLDTSLSQTTL